MRKIKKKKEKDNKASRHVCMYVDRHTPIYFRTSVYCNYHVGDGAFETEKEVVLVEAADPLLLLPPPPRGFLGHT